MPWHVHARLPDGRTAAANHDDPIVRIMRRINNFRPKPGDLQHLAEWLDAHADQSADCLAGTCHHK